MKFARWSRASSLPKWQWGKEEHACNFLWIGVIEEEGEGKKEAGGGVAERRSVHPKMGGRGDG